MRNVDTQHRGPPKDCKARQRRQNLCQSFKIVGLGMPPNDGLLLFLYDAYRREQSNLQNAQQCSVDCEIQHTYWPVGSRSRARSLLSLSLVIRGQASDNHRLLTEFSRARPSPSIAHTPWTRSVKRQNPRPQRRQVCASREPRTAFQSSIFTMKSCVSQGFSIILTAAQPSEATLSCSVISAPLPFPCFPVSQRRFRLDPDSASI